MADEHQAIVEACLARYTKDAHDFESFASDVHRYFLTHPQLNAGPLPLLHSVRMRVKDPEHLRRKLSTKLAKGDRIDEHNIFSVITDLAGVRLLHLYTEQFPQIDAVIRYKIERNDWVFHEPPIAYTWDPESQRYFGALGLRTKLRETFYTSIHYVIRPRYESPLCCEIQVRTLFEEVWSEIDHAINYPVASTNKACTDQLRALTKLVAAGSRLVDSIVASHSRTDPEKARAEMAAMRNDPTTDTAQTEGYLTSGTLAPPLRLQCKTPHQRQSQWATLAFRLLNTGSKLVPLQDVTLRYWFTGPDTANYLVMCNYGLGPANCSHLRMTIETVQGFSRANRVLEIRFLASAGSLQPGGSSEMQVGFHQADWAMMDQSTHFSYVPGHATSFRDCSQVTVYLGGTLAWGSEPS